MAVASSTKGDKKNLAVVRGEGIQKRKNTLLQEFKKVGVYVCVCVLAPHIPAMRPSGSCSCIMLIRAACARSERRGSRGASSSSHRCGRV